MCDSTELHRTPPISRRPALEGVEIGSWPGYIIVHLSSGPIPASMMIRQGPRRKPIEPNYPSAFGKPTSSGRPSIPFPAGGRLLEGTPVHRSFAGLKRRAAPSFGREFHHPHQASRKGSPWFSTTADGVSSDFPLMANGLLPSNGSTEHGRRNARVKQNLVPWFTLPSSWNASVPDALSRASHAGRMT
jgi:hypothetical protein